MAANLKFKDLTDGKEIEVQADILQRLSANGEYLESSTSKLLLEIKVLNKLIYKSKNTHSKEKFFKCLEKIKKCLCKWKVLCLHTKVIATCKSVGKSQGLPEILNEIMFGGQLSIKIILLCQETVQYSLAYLSLGFFVAFHVTLISLLSRMWVLQKDCWIDLVECYKLVRSLLQNSGNHNSLNSFPECLITWLGEDVKGIFTARTAEASGISLTSGLGNSILQQFHGAKNDNALDSPTIFTDELDQEDIGEPVEDTRTLIGVEESPRYSTSKLNDGTTVSELEKSLTLEFKRATRTFSRENESSEQNTKFGRSLESRRSNKRRTRKTRCKLHGFRQHESRLILRKRRSSFHFTKRSTSRKKMHCRYTLRSLLAATSYSDISTKSIQTLLKFLKFSLHSRVSHEREIILRIQRLLEKELSKRTHDKTESKVNGYFSKELDTDFEASFRRTYSDENCGMVNYERKDGLDERALEERCKNEGFRSFDLKNNTFSKLSREDKQTESKDIKQDEIDDIFGTLGL